MLRAAVCATMGRALVALGLALLALAPATCAFVSVRAIDAARYCTTAAPMRRCDADPPPATWRTNLTGARVPADADADVRRTERILVDLFSALLQADDVTLLERQAHGMGVAYLDTNFSMCRPPMLLRNSVREIMRRYGLPLIPLERKWTRVAGNQTVDAGFL